jgi:hypothetical protein
MDDSTCMTLFAQISINPVFTQVLDKYIVLAHMIAKLCTCLKNR